MHRLLGVLLMIIVATSLQAQRNGNSPYSRFGIGDIADPSFNHLRQMGSISTAFADPFHVNIGNPASYAFLKAAAFEIGMSAKRTILEDGEQISEPIWSGNLDYLSLAFPLQNDLNQLLDRELKPYRFGMAFTLAPTSNVAYNIESTTVDPELGEVRRNYNGKGGTYKFLWGNSFKYKNFAVGTNLGYQFGKINYERIVDFVDEGFIYDDIFTNEYSASGFLMDLGVLYTFVLNKKAVEEKANPPINSITLGLTWNSPTSLTTNSDISHIAIQTIANVGQIIDTGLISNDAKGIARIPSKLGFGASYRQGSKFMIGVDYKLQDWSGYFNEATGEVKETLKNASSVSLGGYYRPNYKSYTSYWKRAYYRFGFYNRSEPIVVNDEQVKTYALTAGIGFPFVFQRKVSHASLGIELGKRGGGSLIGETFCNFTLGFTFNDDEWFLKRKYN